MPQPITNGAELVRRLRELGTGEAKLAVARAELERVHREERRVAASDEVLAALDAALPPEHLTLTKARQLAATGEYTGPAVEEHVPVEDRLAGRKSPPPPPARPPATQDDARAILARLEQLERDGRARAEENAALRAAADEQRARADKAEHELAAARAAAGEKPAEGGDKPADAAKPDAAKGARAR